MSADHVQAEYEARIAAHASAAADQREYFKALVFSGWSEEQAFQIVLAWMVRPPGLAFQQLLALIHTMKEE